MVTYRAMNEIVSASFTPMERKRLAAAVTLHHMAQLDDPAFEALWLDNITAEEEEAWDLFATVCESTRWRR